MTATVHSNADQESRRVLIVEDHPDSRDTLRMVIEGWGHEVEVASDGAAGLQKVLDWHPDAAVVDIGLPVLDGYELAKEVRAKVGSKVRLIALSGYSQPQDRHRAAEAGFNVYLTKPADLDCLSQLLVTTR
jgi:CheY-like chemotaxis protein